MTPQARGRYIRVSPRELDSELKTMCGDPGSCPRAPGPSPGAPDMGTNSTLGEWTLHGMETAPAYTSTMILENWYSVSRMTVLRLTHLHCRKHWMPLIFLAKLGGTLISHDSHGACAPTPLWETGHWNGNCSGLHIYNDTGKLVLRKPDDRAPAEHHGSCDRICYCDDPKGASTHKSG